jgi:2-oxoglutarate dehydrogenase E2 component (dihydrolipoamide succinyltransferase)
MATTQPLLTEVPLPHLASMEYATLTTWCKQVGEQVHEGEVICEVTTEKVDTEIESPGSGVVVAHLFEPGAEIALGTVVALLAPPGADAGELDAALAAYTGNGAAAEAAPPPGEAPLAVAVPTATAEPRANGRILASPLAKRLAAEHSIDLTSLTGTGGRGKITRDDVRAAIDSAPATPAAPTQPVRSAPPAPHPAASAPPAPADGQTVDRAGGEIPPGFEDLPVERVNHSGVRRATASNLTRSWLSMPQLTHEIQVDLSTVEDHRRELNPRRVAQGRRKVSVLAFIARATCQALITHPQLNATFTEDAVLRWGKVKLGIAVDTEQGLMVPGIPGAEDLTLPALADAIAGLAHKARNRELTPADMRGVTFAISNSGPLGAWRSPAVVPPTNAAIMGVPTVVRTPVAVEIPGVGEVVAIRPIINLAVTYDHRALDGSDTGAFLKDVKAFLEHKPLDGYL